MKNYGGMYDAHLDVLPGDIKKNIHPKPIFRSSTLFPVFHFPGVSTRFLFMGYWIIKRNIEQVGCVVTLRSLEGEVLHRSNFTIKKPKAYRIELAAQLEGAGIHLDKEFLGSLEVEIFSSVNLFFSFPAGVVNYYGPHFSTYVHVAQRAFNDYEDMLKFSGKKEPEAGFSIYADGNREPFISLINGMEPAKDYKVQMEFVNGDNETLQHEFYLGDLLPYQTHILYPEREVDLMGFLKGGVGTVKVHHHLNWVYSRLIVGNIEKNPPGLSITHTFLDGTASSSRRDYWKAAPPEWHAASLMVPLIQHQGRYTNLYLYPIYSPSSFSIDVEIYNADGVKLDTKKGVAQVSSPSLTIHKIAFRDLCDAMEVDVNQDLTARVIATPKAGTQLPARVKIGLDVGFDARGLPCNICTNLYPFNPKLETKPRTFRWLPVMMDQEDGSLWITNSSPAVDYTREARGELLFFREKDDRILIRKFTIPPSGFKVIYPKKDPELVQHMGDGVGWMVVKSSSPHVNTYYFAEGSSGTIGGDHGF